MQKLPRVLEREPLIDAVFEMRIVGTPPLADFLPGAIFASLSEKPVISRLPAAEFPYPIRANDPALQFSPILRLDLGQFWLSVGDRNFVISCKLPYPKWPSFKAAILDLTARIAGVGVTGKVERYSVKYVNLIEGSSNSDQIDKIDMAIRLGSVEVSGDHMSLQVHRQEGDILHILSVITGAEAQLPNGSMVGGVVVDVDSIRSLPGPEFADCVAGLEPGLEELRQANKAKFFGCLKESTIQEMGPIYD